MKNINLVPTKQKDTKEIKTKLWELNQGICPILKVKVDVDKCALDHIHKLKNDECTIEKGVIRNAIDMRANQLEGLYGKAFKRFMGNDSPITFSEFLRNLADYVDDGAYIENVDGVDTAYIHYTEVPKVKNKLQKSSYNKLLKAYNENKKFPEFPKSGKITVGLTALFKKYNIEPKFYA